MFLYFVVKQNIRIDSVQHMSDIGKHYKQTSQIIK